MIAPLSALGCLALFLLLGAALIVFGPFIGAAAAFNFIRRTTHISDDTFNHDANPDSWQNAPSDKPEKIFQADEGEYVEYTEISDTDTQPRT